MLADAVARHGLGRAILAHRLLRHRQLIATHNENAKVTTLVRTLAIHIEPITLVILERATAVSTQFQLLMNDALTVAVMEHHGLKDLATNVEDFDPDASMTWWKPR